MTFDEVLAQVTIGNIKPLTAHPPVLPSSPPVPPAFPGALPRRPDAPKAGLPCRHRPDGGRVTGSRPRGGCCKGGALRDAAVKRRTQAVRAAERAILP